MFKAKDGAALAKKCRLPKENAAGFISLTASPYPVMFLGENLLVRLSLKGEKTMKVKNLSVLERAAGIIEGVYMAVDEKIGECLMNVVEMIDAVIIDEEKGEAR